MNGNDKLVELDKRFRRKMALLVAIGIPAVLGFSYLLALIGYPTSVWLWCDLINAC